MTCDIYTVKCKGPGLVIPNTFPITVIDNSDNSRTPCECYRDAYLTSNQHPPDFLVYIHDDVTIHDAEWLDQVISVFEEHPDCAVVGLGGATELGREGLYKRPYRITDMARGGYASNQTDWAVHGDLLSDVRRVAVVDAFFMAVRTDFIADIGGWPVGKLSHHCLDLWLACEAARTGKLTYAVPVSCTHHGGGTSTNRVYTEAKWLQGENVISDHQRPHVWLHENYRDVLPIKVRL